MPSAADGQGDGDNIGFDLRARAVGDKAIELDAVPRCVGRDSLGGTRASVPQRPRGLPLLFEVPLVFQLRALRLEG